MTKTLATIVHKLSKRIRITKAIVPHLSVGRCCQYVEY